MEIEDSGGGGGDPASDSSTYQVLAAQDSYPKSDCVFDEPSLSVPFVHLPGEYATYLGKTTDGLIALSNYRLFLQQRNSIVNIPVGGIEQVEIREIVFLHILCKDAKSYRATFQSPEYCIEWQKRITKAISMPEHIENIFAFAFFQWSCDENKDLYHSLTSDADALMSYTAKADKLFMSEVKRLKFDLGGSWRICRANEDYQLCSTYPRSLVVPSSISDKTLESVARFRSSRRIPAVVWRHTNGAVIARCSQPEVGWLGWRSGEDEDLIQAIAEACAYDSPSYDAGTTVMNSSCQSDHHDSAENESSTANAVDDESDNYTSDIPVSKLPDAKAQKDIKKLLIVDARSYATAVANRARGGGVECPEYYPTCEVQFMNLANIHTIRKSHQALRSLVSSPCDIPNWLSLLENTRWLTHISGLVKAAVTVAQAIAFEARPVVVHCSDGWDRTPQITSLAQILLDPYYRTVQGFEVLMEREWVEFGHKFSDRGGCGVGSEDVHERCPVFLQWLDCVHQLIYIFPTSFEFNEAYLIKLAQHVYSNLFGTFICNSSKQRSDGQLGKRTYPVWSLFKLNKHKYTNFLYAVNNQVLLPSSHTKDLQLWKAVYIPELEEAPDIIAMTTTVSSQDEDTPGELVKTKSCDNLLAASPTANLLLRRSSDPNLRESCPNMAMLNSALGAEVNGGGVGVGEVGGVENPFLGACIEGPLQAPKQKESVMEINFSTSLQRVGEQSNELVIEENNSDNCENICQLDCRKDSSNMNNGRLLRELTDSSIEGSTDTLVAELGIIVSDEKESDNSNSNLECNGMLDKSKKVGVGAVAESLGRIELAQEAETAFNSNNSGRKIQQLTKTNVGQSHADMPEEKHDRRASQAQFQAYSCLNGMAANIGACSICLHSKKTLEEVSAVELSRVIDSNTRHSMNGGYLNGAHSNNGDSDNTPSHPITHSTSAAAGIFSTPGHSRTSSAGIPSTPAEERVCLSFGDNHVNSFPNMDGLSDPVDKTTKRLHQIILQHQAEKESLKKYIQAIRHALMLQVYHAKHHHHAHDGTEDQMSLPESIGSGSGGSVGQESGVSDTSWEALEEGETRPTLWVPDHAVENCSGCHTQFWMGLRKHHCRSCGNIFCSECSANTAAIPRENLFQPVRVCGSCFTSLLELHKPKFVTAVSN